ncbi:DUF6588 family protein [Christiangramia salexigens]|uniref:Outer membrane protein beta-barrel domain-containing protein n=1 Tax=Christiangramia salexigens TaxID=1913577 RepID=A0A1L3J7Z0_9FLAO|nr:DUF6588 family protein [Christiangramia salexigens]APG61239.1 hypothetical protein LPB144_12855 [Christiangramia salexigens]
MKKITSLLLLCSLFIFQNSKAQNQPGDLVDDILLIADQFAKPAASAAAYQANSGWFSSAIALDKWEFEISANGNALFVPKSEQSFTVSNNNFKVLRIKNSTTGIVPTAFGKRSDVVYEGEILGQEFEFDAIEGIDKSVVIHPFVQLAVGLPYETEFAMRYAPEITIGEVAVSTVGFGLKHNLSQYFRFNDPDRDLQLAVSGAYNIFDVGYSFQPVDIKIATLDVIDVDANLWMAKALASKKYGNFEVFGGLGATNSNYDYIMGGSGSGLADVNNALLRIGDSQTQFKGDIGFNLYYDWFKFSTMITAGKFFNLNMGLHFRI